MTIALCVHVFAQAQEQPYLLLQGPNKASTRRFTVGNELELKLKGEPEYFVGTIKALYPESQAILIEDLLLSIKDIASIRHERNARGLRNYLKFQGLANIGIIGLVYAFNKETRDIPERRKFAVGAAIVSSVMVIAGSIDRFAKRDTSPGSKYVLKVAGGDLRKADDPERG